jgi:hypothetical protein
MYVWPLGLGLWGCCQQEVSQGRRQLALTCKEGSSGSWKVQRAGVKDVIDADRRANPYPWGFTLLNVEIPGCCFRTHQCMQWVPSRCDHLSMSMLHLMVVML